MKTKEKAKELIDEFKPFMFFNIDDNSMNIDYEIEDNAKQCALICVDEILKAVTTIADEKYDYWQEVKQEIEKL